MRRTALLLASFLLFTTPVHGQFLPYYLGTEVTHDVFDDDGEKVASYTIKVIEKEGNLQDGRLRTRYSFYDEDGKPFFSENDIEMEVFTKNGVTSSTMPELRKALKVQKYFPTGDASTIPLSMAIGDTIPTSVIHIKVLGMDATVTSTDRKVLGHKNVTIAGQSFDCWLVSERTVTKASFISSEVTSKTWYSHDVGGVRQEIYDRKGRLQYTQLLTRYRRGTVPVK